MNSGQDTGPEDPQETAASAGGPAQDDPDDDWTAWRQGPGYSRPLPPEPEPAAGPGERPASRHPYRDRLPQQAPQSADPIWRPKRSPAAHGAPESPRESRAYRAPAPYEPGTYRTPGAHQESSAYGAPPPAPYERGSYPRPAPHEESAAHQAPSSYEEQGPQEVPKPRPYVDRGDHGAPGRYGGPGNHTGSPNRHDPHDVPELFDEPAGYEEPGEYRPDDADSGAGRDEGQEAYKQFWEPEGRGGGAHASPSKPGRPSPPTPRTPPPSPPRTPPPSPPGTAGDTSPHRASPARRQLVLLIGTAAVIVAAIVIALVLLFGHNGKARHPVAGGHATSSAPGHRASPSAPASAPPVTAQTGASGHLGVPSAIGSLRLNPALTRKFVGPHVRHQDASSFLVRDSDVVSGFYTANPAATTFTAQDSRLMFLTAYLAGTGNARSALHDFMTNRTFTGQRQVSAGRLGGVAACGLLPSHPAPVAHCMWADANTYADFYAWNSSPSALARTMIAVRPQIERRHH